MQYAVKADSSGTFKVATVAALLCACATFVAPNAAAELCANSVTIESGDTLSGVASRCGTTVSALLMNNPQIDRSGAVRVGETVHLPRSAGALLADERLDELLAPIALHPDVLLSEILPASTYPLEIVQAARWAKDHPGAEPQEDQDWSDSVKALTRYPELLDQMNEDIDWTIELGDAFLAQPDDVFDSIQRLRHRADAAGTLVDNSVQNVVHEASDSRPEKVIRIVHSDPYYVHLPSYDPHYAYGRRGHHYAGLSFGGGLLLGGWLSHSLDWHHRHIFFAPYRYDSYRTHYRYNHYVPYYQRSGYRSIRNHNRVHHYGRSQRHHYAPGQRWAHDRRHYNNKHRGNRYGNDHRYRNHRGYGSRVLPGGARTVHSVAQRDYVGESLQRRAQGRNERGNTRRHQGANRTAAIQDRRVSSASGRAINRQQRAERQARAIRQERNRTNRTNARASQPIASVQQVRQARQADRRREQSAIQSRQQRSAAQSRRQQQAAAQNRRTQASTARQSNNQSNRQNTQRNNQRLTDRRAQQQAMRGRTLRSNQDRRHR